MQGAPGQTAVPFRLPAVSEEASIPRIWPENSLSPRRAPNGGDHGLDLALLELRKKRQANDMRGQPLALGQAAVEPREPCVRRLQVHGAWVVDERPDPRLLKRPAKAVSIGNSDHEQVVDVVPSLGFRR